ncbi:PH domain-like protein [Piedraia hortae CBS 480.64]|uniref:PH domain-like protein n=1 Tax=Piedraia hortae CBS 480.64 TaxID=1314780 RepID=A0A6A7CA39_9PEZI|nr:PH domain-like protein [Piedraia hortae CBS 480.64]
MTINLNGSGAVGVQELNLGVLRRYDPSIASIIDLAPFAVVYTFSPETSTWANAGFEGTLFICQLTNGLSQVFVLNRKSLENYILPLSAVRDIDLDAQTGFIMVDIPGHEQKMVGFWIYSDDEKMLGIRDRIARTIMDCVERCKKPVEQTGQKIDLSRLFGQ